MRNKMLFCLAVILACFSCPGVPQASQGHAVRTCVSILPQAYFVQRVGGANVEVTVLVGPGQSHETYEPAPQQISSLARSQVYFTVGVPFEKTLAPKIRGMFPGLNVVDMSAGVRFLSFSTGSGEHGTDPHVWLDPKQVKIMASNVCRSLKGIDPGRAREYDANLTAFLADLESLDKEITGILAPVRGRTLYVFHPAFQYFCRSYGLRQVAFEFEGKEPSARQMARLMAQARKENARVVFVQPQFSQKAARAIARSIGGRVVTIDPLPRDYLRDMSAMAVTIRDSLLGTGKGQVGLP